MRTIYKYVVPLQGQSSIDMPAGPILLSVQIQEDKICTWAIVDTEKENAPIHFAVRATGRPIDLRAAWNYLGTVQHDSLVWHVFYWRYLA